MIIKTDKDFEKGLKKKFCITNNKGFHLILKNGWRVSIQWGWGNYSDNHHNDVKEMREFPNCAYASDTAEVWSWNEKGTKHYPENPLGYLTPEEVLEFIKKVARKRK